MGVRVREKVKGSGEWWVYVYRDRKRTAKKIGDKRTANKFARLMQEQLKLGQCPTKSGIPTLEEFFQKVKRTYLATAVRETTRMSYETSFRIHILPELGKLRLDEITREELKEFVALLVTKNLARASIRIIVSELSAVLNHAVEDAVINSNPATRLGKFYKQAPVMHEEVQPLTAEEVVLFLQTVKRHSPKYYPLFLCAIHTGLRSGELAGLQWLDIDFHGKFVVVRRPIVHGQIHLTKSDKIRRVDLSDDLLAVLQELRRQRKEKWLAKGRNEIPDWVSCNREGNPLDMHNVKNRHFYKCLEKAGLRRIRFHDLRHTFASLLIQNGESLAYVKDQLGHSSIKLTVDVYGHLVPGANRQAVNKLPSLNDSRTRKDEKELAER